MLKKVKSKVMENLINIKGWMILFSIGFFSGLVPRLIGDAVYISLSASLVYFISKYLVKKGPVEGVTVMASNVCAVINP